LESNQRPQSASFETVLARLLAFVNGRIRNGELSERTLARLIGVSQPQLHNVLKGERKLHTTLADALLRHFQISLLDLFTNEELLSRLQPMAVPRAVTGESRQFCFIRKPMARASHNPGSQWEAS
jgi:DNA-binding XRE family transcriptional regulator